MATVRAMEGQSMFDIAAQTSGSIEAAFLLAAKNGVSITDDLTPGQILEMVAVMDKDIVNYYSNKGVAPVTGITQEDVINISPEGIGFWAIETEFIVS